MENRLFVVAILFYTLIFSNVSGDVRRIEFVKQPRDQISIEGSDVLFECSAVTTPTEKVSYLWKKDGEYIDTSKVPRTSNSSGGNLVIRSILADDFGVYECVAMCDEGALLSSPAKLEKAALSFMGETRGVHVKEGGYHLFRLVITTNIHVRVEWNLCSQLQVSCKDIDRGRMFVTADRGLLISPILAGEDSYYPRFTIYGGKYFRPQQGRMGVITITDYLSNNWKLRCPVPDPVFLGKSYFTVHEGSNLTLDCLAVAKRCVFSVAVKWKDRLGNELSSSRKLQLVNVTKADQGLYACIIDAHGDPSHSYNVTVIEKPKLVTEPSNTQVLQSDNLVSPGVITGADSVDWYTNAEKITRNSRFYEVSPKYHLKIFQQSSALSGFYQIVYRNKAGTITRTVKVDISNSVCGDRSDDLEDDIKFLRPSALAKRRMFHCVWILQTLSLSALQFYFTQFVFSSPCDKLFIDVHSGLQTRNSTQNYHFCSTAVPNRIFGLRGPYITIYLEGNGTDISNQGFEIIYGPNITIPEATSTTPQTSSRTKPTNLTDSTVYSSTRKEPGNYTIAPWSGTGRTTSSRLSTKISQSTATSKAAVKTFSKSETVKRVTKSSDKSQITSVVPPKKAGQGASSNSDIALYASIIAVGFIAVIIIGVFYYRRRKLKVCHKKEPENNGVLLEANKSSANYYRRTETYPAKETCFTINGHSQFRGMSTAPNAATTLEPRGYKTMRSRIEQDFTSANYTALQFEAKSETQPYTSIDFNSKVEQNGVTAAPTYAMILPEDDAQYTPLCESTITNAYPVDTSLPAPSPYQQNGQPESLWPVYQELEVEGGCQHRKVGDRVNDGTRTGMTEPVDHTYAETVAEPFYHVLGENKPGNPQRETSNQKKGVDSSVGYLAPRRSKNLQHDDPKQQAYTPAHYVEPNLGDRGSFITNSQREQYQTDDNSSRKQNSFNGVNSSRIYEPITSEDDMYLAIMN